MVRGRFLVVSTTRVDMPVSVLCAIALFLVERRTRWAIIHFLPRLQARRAQPTNGQDQPLAPQEMLEDRGAGQNAPEVVEFTDERRGSSVAEQLIRKHPEPPPDSTQHDVEPGDQTQQP